MKIMKINEFFNFNIDYFKEATKDLKNGNYYGIRDKYVGNGNMSNPKGSISFDDAQKIAKETLKKLNKSGVECTLDKKYGIIIIN